LDLQGVYHTQPGGTMDWTELSGVAVNGGRVGLSPPDGTAPSRGQHISGVRIHCPREWGVRGMLPQPNGLGSRIKTTAQTAAEQKLMAVLAKNLCPTGAALQSSLWTTIRGTNAKGAR
jgi:hypothetical protein